MRKPQQYNPSSEKYDYASDLTTRALRRHHESRKPGSFSEVYNSMTQETIRVLAPQLVEEARNLARLHDRPLDKVLNAAVKSLTALATAVADLREAEAAERARATQDPSEDDDEESTFPVSKKNSTNSFRV